MTTLDNIHFGSVGKPLPEWRAAAPDEDPDDELTATPPDVIAVLGFDPTDEDEG